MKPRKRTAWRSAAAALATALVVAACGGTEEAVDEPAPAPQEDSSEEEAPAAPSDDPITIGVSLPLTGEFSVPGSKHRDGYQFCVDEINAKGGLLDRPVELVVTDNRSDPEVGVSQYERFINVDQVDMLFGTFSSLLTFPISTVTQNAGYVMPIPSGGALRIWERGYDTQFYFQQTAAEFTGAAPVGALEYYLGTGVVDEAPATAAVIFADDFFAEAIAKGLRGGEVSIPGTDRIIPIEPGYLPELDIEVVYDSAWPIGFTNWLQLANEIKAEAPDAVFAATASADEAVEIVRALETVGFRPDFLYTSQGTQFEFQEALGDLADGVVISASWHPQADFMGLLAGEEYSNTDFIESFTTSFGRAPDEDEAIPFALCQGMEQAVIGTGGTDQAAMRDWLASRTLDDPVRTILGPFSWDERGLPFDRSQNLTQWQDGELKFVHPAGGFPGVVDMVYPRG